MNAIFNSMVGRIIVFLLSFFVITLFFFGWNRNTTWKFMLAYLLWSGSGVDQRLGRRETRKDSMDGKLSAVGERLAKVETKLEGGHLVLSR